MKIGIMGAGIFGSTTAISLSRVGHNVTIFERQNDILCGTTGANTNRLHLGLHYPRHLPTGKQSLEGSSKFEEMYPGSVNYDFNNYYAIASSGSKTLLNDYKNFLQKLEAGSKIVDIPEQLFALGFSNSNIDGFWEVREGVIDVAFLKSLIYNYIQTENISLKLSTEVDSLEYDYESKWKINHSNGSENFDIIIKATYATDNIVDNIENKDIKKFESVLVLEISGFDNRFGLTVIDGEFMTILPNGFGTTSLLYAPDYSRLKETHGYSIDLKSLEPSDLEIQMAENQILQRLAEWFPKASDINVEKRILSTRTLLPDVESTDARPSFVKEISPGYFDVWSGKIDHCVLMAEDIIKIIGVP
jgi:hypothetical protein